MKHFDEFLDSVVQQSQQKPRPLPPGECQDPTNMRCGICLAGRLSYGDELRLKNEALRLFWKQTPQFHHEPILASPLGRGYRVVSKRKVFQFRHGTRLALIDPSRATGSSAFHVVACAIEASGHAEIYSWLQEALGKTHGKPLAAALQYVILKGNYLEQSVIFNVKTVSHSVVHSLNAISKSLTRTFPSIVAVFLFEGVEDDRYYLGMGGNGGPNPLKKIFGKPELFRKIGNVKYLYHPLAFTQVNEAAVEQLVSVAMQLLEPKPYTYFYDLYCGYGLFALQFAPRVKGVLGLDLSREAIQSAIRNTKRNSIINARFVSADMTEMVLDRMLQRVKASDLVLLDPPHNGAGPGVVERIGVQRPGRVLHVFCNIDIIPDELARWKAAGYHAKKIVPLDSFPGTSTIETMVLLVPDN